MRSENIEKSKEKRAPQPAHGTIKKKQKLLVEKRGSKEQVRKTEKQGGQGRQEGRKEQRKEGRKEGLFIDFHGCLLFHQFSPCSTSFA